jgi:hypothetical protein
MKAAEFITRLDEARHGRRVTEDTTPIAPAPSHAPTHTAQWKTASHGMSKDEEGNDYGEKGSGIKKKETAMPTPIGKSPSHAPTSTAQWKTGSDSKEDEGETPGKEAMKENLFRALTDSNDEDEIQAILASHGLSEGGHKPGCKCAFCANKGKFGKKSEEMPKEDDHDDDDDDKMTEGFHANHAGMGGFGQRVKKDIFRGSRMGFRHSKPRPKAAYGPGPDNINPNQPAMESSIERMADKLLDYPE